MFWILTPCWLQHLQIFSVLWGYFHCVHDFLCCAKSFQVWSGPIYFCFYFFFFLSLGDWSNKILIQLVLKNVLPILSPGSFIVLHLKLMVGEAGPEASASPLVAGARFRCRCWGFQDQCLYTGVWAWVLGPLVDRDVSLRDSGHKRPAGKWAVSQLGYLLDLAWGVPVLAPIDWWARPGPFANKLKGRFQNDTYQHQWPWNRIKSWNIGHKCVSPVSACLSGRLSKISWWVWPMLLSNYCFCPGSQSVWDFVCTI